MCSQRRVLITDDDAGVRRQLGTLLSDAGFVPLLAGSVVEAEAAFTAADDSEPVSLILLEPRIEDNRGLTLLRSWKGDAEAADTPIIVVTEVTGEEDVARAFEAGADDLVRKPVGGAELLARIRHHIRVRTSTGELARKKSAAHVMLELTQAFASSLDFRQSLYTVVRRIAEVVKVDRASIVLAPEHAQTRVGYVVVASDDEALSNLKVDLSTYPEIQQVLRTGEDLTIDDVATHPLLDGVREVVQRDHVGSMTMLPIIWQEKPLGVLFLRASAERGVLSDRDMGFCRIVANATAIALCNARVMQTLRDHTKQETFARFEAERRLASFKRYADLFASATEGIGVMDPSGTLVFANPRAYEILGAEPDSLDGKVVRDLVHADDEAKARRIWEGFSGGGFPREVDLRIERRRGDVITINVSFSRLLHGEGDVLFTFRDVTQARKMEAELVRTKEFLESLIHASVDGIVAADMCGKIILFNEGAEKIYGYSADDVIGKISVRSLYAEGMAAEVMAMLRSKQHGGVGRLESIRMDAVDQAGRLVPISLSAAMIYQGSKPVATFGIFTDLRDRMRIEERLVQAQQKLALTEKQALIAELAGTAAHELNQPLTSVMGYAELLMRKLERNSAEQNAADIIVREAERMADIVRKIGKITKYETKSYVGQQKILDLDKAAGGDEPKARAGEQ